jgi:hypothetical protein
MREGITFEVKAGDRARLEAIASDRNSTQKTMSGRLGSCY